MSGGGLLIAQISDTHIGAGAERGDDPNLARLEQVLEHLCGLPRRPDLLLVTGDLADPDEPGPYRILRDRLARCPFPTHVALGNHDSRQAARVVFPGGDDSFLHYALDAGPLRLIVLDTLEVGRHGGGFCEARAAWLRARLAEAPERPTLVALHHPPIDTGIAWMTTAPAEPWIGRLAATMAGHDRIVALVAGHIHRPIASTWNRWPVRVCPSVAPPLALDLSALDPEAPDDRAMILDGPPGYALHRWSDGTLTTHVDYVAGQPVLARFDARMQPLVRGLFAERS